MNEIQIFKTGGITLIGRSDFRLFAEEPVCLFQNGKKKNTEKLVAAQLHPLDSESRHR